MTRFTRHQIWFHWLSLLLIATAYAAIELKGIVPKTTPWHDYLKIIHFNAGCFVLVLMCIRLYFQRNQVTPEIIPTPPQWQLTFSKAIHYIMYAAFILLPLLGLIMLAVGGKQWDLVGISIPAFSVPDKATSKSIKEIHETIADIGYFLIALHAGAAIYHHYVVKDNTLQRMLPK